MFCIFLAKICRQQTLEQPSVNTKILGKIFPFSSCNASFSAIGDFATKDVAEKNLHEGF